MKSQKPYFLDLNIRPSLLTLTEATEEERQEAPISRHAHKALSRFLQRHVHHRLHCVHLSIREACSLLRTRVLDM